MILLLAGLATAAPKSMETGSIGLGIGGGSQVTGLSLKHRRSPKASAQLVVGGFGLGRVDGVLGGSFDMLFNSGPLVEGDGLSILVEYGLGVFAGFGDDTLWLGPQGVLGLGFEFSVAPLDLVIEWRPHLVVLPDVEPEPVSFGGHLRFWF